MQHRRLGRTALQVSELFAGVLGDAGPAAYAW